MKTSAIKCLKSHRFYLVNIRSVSEQVKLMSGLKPIFVFAAILLCGTINGQQEVNYNGVKMNSNLEIVQAQIAKESMLLMLYEVDMTKYDYDNCKDCPTSKVLSLDVNFTKPFKFPITEDDSVFVRVTHLQKNLAENEHNLAQVNNMNSSRNVSEEDQMKRQAEMMKTKGQEIAKLMQSGKLSPEDAQKQLLALSEPYLEKFDNSAIANTETQEYVAKPHFSWQFYNDDTNVESEPFSGYLHIKTFNETHFIAEYRGTSIDQCVEKRSASSPVESQKCKAVQSQYLPDTRVLREGKSSVTIRVNIKEFLDNR